MFNVPTIWMEARARDIFGNVRVHSLMAQIRQLWHKTYLFSRWDIPAALLNNWYIFHQNSSTQHTKYDKIGYMFRLIKPLSGPYLNIKNIINTAIKAR